MNSTRRSLLSGVMIQINLIDKEKTKEGLDWIKPTVDDVKKQITDDLVEKVIQGNKPAGERGSNWTTMFDAVNEVLDRLGLQKAKPKQSEPSEGDPTMLAFKRR